MMSDEIKRILITGMGVVSPFGTGLDAFWEGLVAGRDGITPIESFNTADYRVKAGGVVHETSFDFPEDLSLAEADLAVQFCARALREALENAGLTHYDLDASQAALVLSTNFGQSGIYHELYERYARDGVLDEAGLRRSLFEHTAACLGDLWGIHGPRAMLSLSCASGNAALSYGTELIRRGRADVAVCGGYDLISEFAWSGLLVLRTMTTKKIMPFDKERSGTVFGEGAGVLVLESEEHAHARGIEATVELAGHHTNNNAYHLTAPDKDGRQLVVAMKAALADANVAPDEVDHVNAHGTGTRYNDKTETAAIKAVLGKHAGGVPVNSIKSMIGHLMGAAGAVEAVATVRAVETGVVPPTINFQTPDPECDLSYVTSGTEEHEVRCAVSNSSGLGGCNSVIVLRRT